MAPVGSRWQAQVERALEPLPDDPGALGAVCLEASTDSIALLRLGGGVPECVRVAANSGKFCAVVQEPGAATAWVPRSLLPKTSDLKSNDGADEVEPGQSWCPIRVGRPGSGKGGLKVPAAPGSAGMVCALLAEADVGARLLSAFGTEVLLIPEEALTRAGSKLVSHGHALWPSSRLCDQRPWEAARERPNATDLAKQLAGAWSLVQREEPPGTVVEEFTDGDGPLRLQAPGGLFIELRVPPGDMRGELKQNSFGGRCSAVQEDGRIICSHLRAVDFQPPSVEVSQFQVTLSTSCLEVVGHPRHEEYRELWAKLGNTEAETDFVALELQSEVPEPKTARCGIWLFCGTRFARIVGLPRGSGLVAGTACRSLGQLQRLRGYAEVRYELRENYEALYGTVEEPGLLKIRRMAWQPDKTDTAFYSATDEATGEIVVGQDSIVHILPGGRRETWRIVEWTFDPFTPPGQGEEVATDKGDSRSSSQPTQARSQSSEQEKEEDEEDVKLRSESPERKDEKEEGKTKAAGKEGDAADDAAEAEPLTLSPEPKLRSGSASPVAEEAKPQQTSPSPPKTRPKAKPKDKAPRESKEEKEPKKTKERKEGKDKRKKRRKKEADAEDEAKPDNDGAASPAASANEKAGKDDKKKKRKKLKKSKKKDAEQTENAAENEKSDAPAQESGDEGNAEADAPSSQKDAASPQEASQAAPESTGGVSAKESSAPKSPAPDSPAASPSKRSTSPAATEKKKRGRGARNELNAVGKRKKSSSRGRKKDRKSESPKRSSPARNNSPAKRGSSPRRRTSPAGKRGGSPRKRKSSRSQKRNSPRRGSPKRRRSPSRKRSPSKKRSPSRRRSPQKRSRSRGGRARGRARSNSGRAGRGGRGDRGRSRSRSRSGDRKKRKK